MSQLQEGCARIDRRLSAYVDDELDAVHCLEVEEHLAQCPTCAESLALLYATRASLQATCAQPAPPSLRNRLALALDTEVEAPAAMGGDGIAVSPVAAPPSRWRHIVPFAAAATIALIFGAVRLQDQDAATAGAKTETVAPAGITLEGLIDDLVMQHAHPPPPETTDPEGVRRFDPYVGLRVTTPVLNNGTYVGARLQQRSALLQYMLRDRQRVTMYVFDPKRVSMRAQRLRPVGDEGPLVGRVRGYTVAAATRDGVGYVLATELGDDEAVRLIADAVVE